MAPLLLLALLLLFVCQVCEQANEQTTRDSLFCARFASERIRIEYLDFLVFALLLLPSLLLFAAVSQLHTLRSLVLLTLRKLLRHRTRLLLTQLVLSRRTKAAVAFLCETLGSSESNAHAQTACALVALWTAAMAHAMHGAAAATARSAPVRHTTATLQRVHCDKCANSALLAARLKLQLLLRRTVTVRGAGRSHNSRAPCHCASAPTLFVSCAPALLLPSRLLRPQEAIRAAQSNSSITMANEQSLRAPRSCSISAVQH